VRRQGLKARIVPLSPVQLSVLGFFPRGLVRLNKLAQKKTGTFQDYFLFHLSVEQNENTEMNESDCEGKKAMGE